MRRCRTAASCQCRRGAGEWGGGAQAAKARGKGAQAGIGLGARHCMRTCSTAAPAAGRRLGGTRSYLQALSIGRHAPVTDRARGACGAEARRQPAATCCWHTAIAAGDGGRGIGCIPNGTGGPGLERPAPARPQPHPRPRAASCRRVGKPLGMGGGEEVLCNRPRPGMPLGLAAPDHVRRALRDLRLRQVRVPRQAEPVPYGSHAARLESAGKRRAARDKVREPAAELGAYLG